jgi:hypothetical protein
MNSIDRRLARLKASFPKRMRESIERMRIREIEEKALPEIPNVEWHPGIRILPAKSYIYFIECNEFIKIGFTTRWRHRFTSLGVGMPYTIRVLCLFAGSKDDERSLHIHFWKHRHKGEWFRKSPDIFEYVEEARRR